MTPRSLSTGTNTRSPLARLPGCFGGLVGLVVIIGAVFVFTTGADAIDAPWAYSYFGHPTLTGHWAGTLTTTSGIKFALYLDVQRNGGDSSEGDGKSRAYFIGSGSWCDNHGRYVQSTALGGSVPTFTGYGGSADDIDFHLDTDKTPAPLGLVPNNFHGKWEGDTLILISDFSVNTGSALEYSDSNPDQSQPVTFRLKKAEIETFKSACAQLG